VPFFSIIHGDFIKLALGSNHWICSCVLLLGEFYWGDEDADDTALPCLQFR
jgi:hypothetical protein